MKPRTRKHKHIPGKVCPFCGYEHKNIDIYTMLGNASQAMTDSLIQRMGATIPIKKTSAKNR